MKRIFKKGILGTAGLSLVELIISMAILAVVGTAIGGAMYVSSRSFTRGSSEVNVQEEAQVSSNLICDWLVDATSVIYDPTNDTEITIVHEGIDTIRVFFDGSDLRYSAVEDAGGTHDGVLGSNVSGVKFASTFEDDRNVTVSIDYFVNGRTYHAVTDTTSRNFGFISNGGVGSSDPIINVTGLPVQTVSGATHYLVYLEPGQTDFKVDCIIYNWENVSGASFTIDQVSGGSDVTLTKNNPPSNSFELSMSATVQAGLNDASARSFKLTAINASGGMDIKYVDILIRRVNRVYFDNNQNDKTATPTLGEKGAQNTTYTESLNLGLQNWEMNPFILAGKYDSDIPYVDPSVIEVFCKKANGTAYTNIELTVTEARDNSGVPVLNIKLKEDLDEDIYIVVGIPHAGGFAASNATKNCAVNVHNKTNTNYTIQGRYYAILKIEKKNGGHLDPFNNVGGGIRRGAPATTIADFNDVYENQLVNYIKENYAAWTNNPNPNYEPTMAEVYAGNPTFCSVMYYRVHDENAGEEDSDYEGYFVLDNVRNYEDLFSDWTGRRLRDSAASLFKLDKAYDVKVEVKVKINGVIHNCGYSTGSVPAAQAFFYDETTTYFTPTLYGEGNGINGATNYMNVSVSTNYSNGTSSGWDNCLTVPAYIDSLIFNTQKPSYVMQVYDEAQGKFVDCANSSAFFTQTDRWAESAFTLNSSSPFLSHDTTFSNVAFDEDNGFSISGYRENIFNYNGCNVQILAIKNSQFEAGKNYRVVWRTTYSEAQTVNPGTICADCQYSSHNGTGSVGNMQSNTTYHLSDETNGTYGCLYIHATP